jgi:hypothetical protein
MRFIENTENPFVGKTYSVCVAKPGLSGVKHYATKARTRRYFARLPYLSNRWKQVISFIFCQLYSLPINYSSIFVQASAGLSADSDNLCLIYAIPHTTYKNVKVSEC